VDPDDRVIMELQCIIHLDYIAVNKSFKCYIHKIKYTLSKSANGGVCGICFIL